MGFLPSKDNNNEAERIGDYTFNNLDGDMSKLSGEAKVGFATMVSYLRDAHGIMRGLLERDNKLVKTHTEALTAKLKASGVTDKDDQVALLSLIIAAASSISPKTYGEDDSWGRNRE
jgi:hypothetical protein